MSKKPNETTTTSTATEVDRVEVSIVALDGNGIPIEGVEVAIKDKGIIEDKDIKKDKDIKSKVSALYETNKEGLVKLNLAPLDTIILSKTGLIDKNVKYTGGDTIMARMIPDTVLNRKLQEVADDYEEISKLTTGNSANEESVHEECQISLPPLNRKILDRLNSSN